MKTLKITLFALATVLVVSCNKEAETTAVVTDDVATDVQDVESAPAMASNETLAENTVPGAAPILTLESSVYDFGDVQANSTTEREAEFTNTGESPLIIKSAKASCGCTVPEYSETPIAPGEKGSLKVSFKAPATNGKQTKTVTLTTNTSQGVEKFNVSANVVGGNSTAPRPVSQPQAQTLPAPNLGQ